MLRLFAIFLLALPLQLAAQLPSVMPAMVYTGEDGTETEESAYDGDAPFTATFKAQPSDVGDYTGIYEWQFTRQGESTPFLRRYEEDTQYTFNESGTYSVVLLATFVLGTDTLQYDQSDGGEAFTVTISESKLEVPNAFTPNGDGVNDVFRVKEGYKSIISFKARVFDRWGKKLYEWDNPAGGWDGKGPGGNAPDGAYYLNIEAKGADGKKYNIKKVINLLRGYTEKDSLN